MKIGVTGATGFIGRYIVQELLNQGHQLRCWYRNKSAVESVVGHADCNWIQGELGDAGAVQDLLDGCDAVVHSALWKPGERFQGGEGDVVEFAQRNVIGSLQLMEAARLGGVNRFVFISTCAVHDQILDDRKLDESHPLWAASHYGAHKAAIEKFVHSFGLGSKFNVCSLRPTGVYGLMHPPENSKWFELVKNVVESKPVEVRRGGKEVHAADVARAVQVLLMADPAITAGQSFNCYDRYVSLFEVAKLAKEMSDSKSEIQGEPTVPKHQIETAKLEKLGMKFGGDQLLRATVKELVQHVADKNAAQRR